MSPPGGPKDGARLCREYGPRLCQRESASCGACCGLYNGADFSREGVAAELRRRTRLLAATAPTCEAFRAAAGALAADGPSPVFPSVRVCPLLGFLDGGERRVGCLAHPAVTGGADLRHCGAYEADTCESFQCPSASWLSDGEAAIAEAATGDWHLYGIVVTDVPFLRATLAAVSDEVGATVELRHLRDPRFRAALRHLLDLKTELAPGSEGLFGAFARGPDGEPTLRRIDYAGLGRTSRHDVILTCVGADPRSGNDLEALEREVRRRVDRCVAAFPVPPPP